MKKKFLGAVFALAAAFGLMTNVNAAWSGYGSTLTTDGDKITIGTEGQGAVIKDYAGQEITEEGVSVSINVDLDLEALNDSSFTIAPSTGDGKDAAGYPNHVADIEVSTKVENGIATLTSRWVGKDFYTIKESGIYTYTWTLKKAADGNVKGNFKVENYGKVLCYKDFIYDVKSDLAGATVLVPTVTRSVWIFGGVNGVDASKKIQKELSIWTKLPPLPEKPVEEPTKPVVTTQAKEKNPNTADNMPLYLMGLFAGVAGIGLCAKKLVRG